MQTHEAVDLYRREVAARGGSFFWPTLRWSDGTRHFVATPQWDVRCPRCDSDIVILHGLFRDALGCKWRHLTCGECYRNWRSNSPNAVAFDWTTVVCRG
jgi:hypothetical protein